MLERLITLLTEKQALNPPAGLVLDVLGVGDLVGLVPSTSPRRGTPKELDSFGAGRPGPR